MITSKIDHVVIKKLMMKQDNIRAILPSPESKNRTRLIQLTAKLVSKILEQQTEPNVAVHFPDGVQSGIFVIKFVEVRADTLTVYIYGHKCGQN